MRMGSIEILNQYWSATSSSKVLELIGVAALLIAFACAFVCCILWINDSPMLSRLTTGGCAGVCAIVAVLAMYWSHYNNAELYYEIHNSAMVQQLLEDEESGWDFIDQRGEIVTITRHETRCD